MKIVHVTQSLGGVRTYIEHLFQYSNADSYQYAIIAPEHSELEAFCKERNVTYYPIKIQRSINPFKDFVSLFKIISILKREKPDIIHTHSAKGGYLGRLAGKFVSAKVIYAPHAFSYLSFTGVKRIIFYALEWVARNWTDILLAVSHSEANRAIHEVGYSSHKVEVILNSIPVAGTVPFRNYQRCNHIGMIARLTYQKNPFLFLDIAVKLLKKYPQLQFSILGAGLCDHLSKDIDAFLVKHELQDKISILKWGDNETSKNFLQNTDVFLMTSVFEGLPYSLLEAMYYGNPCVVTKVDGNTDVIQNGENGFACLSADEFCSKIGLIIENEDLRRRLGLAGHRYVKDIHDVKKNVALLEKLYTKLAAQANLIPINQGKKNTVENLNNYEISSNY